MPLGEASSNIGNSRIDETEKVEPRVRSTMMAFAFNAFLYFLVIVDDTLHSRVRTDAGASPKNIYIKRINFIFDAGVV